VYVLEQIHQTAVREPDKLALVADGRPIAYGAFCRLIEDRRRTLQAQLPESGAVILSVDSMADAWILSLAARSLGLHAAVVREAQQVELFADLAVAGLITLSSEARPSVAAPNGAPHLVLPSVFDQPIAEDGPLPPLPKDLRAGGQVMLTSGTTGRSKRVLSIRGCKGDMMQEYADRYLELGERFRQHGPDTVLNIFNMGLWTGAGHSRPLYVWSLGGTVVAHAGEDIERALDWPGITHTLATPAFLNALNSLPEGAFPCLPDMQLMVVSGNLSPALVREVRRRLTPRILINLSATEVGAWARTLIESDEDLRWYRLDPTRRVEVVDDAGQPLPSGELGRVRVDLQETRIHGYLGDPETTAEFFSDGWFYPGDLGILDGKGRLALYGRSTDIVHIRGDKYPADPWERAIQEALECEGVCILSGSWRSEEEQLHVFIESRRPIATETLTAAVRATFFGFPGVYVHFVQTLPRTSSGKIRRIELAQQLHSGGFD
jgi:acyl-coenzyme A synthetase/AMP-(fatty) acid ligase